MLREHFQRLRETIIIIQVNWNSFALRWAITERFSDYLVGGPLFNVYTDNNPLTYVLTSAKLNTTGLRWVNELADYNFNIHYKRGKENVDADYLSRRSLDIAELKCPCDEMVGQ